MGPSKGSETFARRNERDPFVIQRKPLECGVFEDAKAARRYDKEIRTRTQNLSKSFVYIAREWGIADGKVLDVGTGTGRLAIEFAKAVSGVQVVGLDLSEVALKLARENVQDGDMSLRTSLKMGDAEDMPFEDDTFDLVISSNTLHLVKNPVSMFNEIHRVLKPQGRFLISDLRRSWLGILTEHIRASYTRQEVQGLLNQSRLQNWTIRDSFFWLNIFSKD
jgi:ubiquinone/menaquinone biosynthesis C-methylase UbiE